MALLLSQLYKGSLQMVQSAALHSCVMEVRSTGGKSSVVLMAGKHLFYRSEDE